VGPRAALDLGEVALAQSGAGFSLQGPNHLLLAQIAVQAAQAALNLAQVADFLAQLHENGSQRTADNPSAGVRGLACDGIAVGAEPNIAAQIAICNNIIAIRNKMQEDLKNYFRAGSFLDFFIGF
jgi:multidrug efflux pump subunit AcrA (membrane-fusion protein)